MDISSLKEADDHYDYQGQGNHRGQHAIEIISLLDSSSSEDSDDDSMPGSTSTKLPPSASTNRSPSPPRPSPLSQKEQASPPSPPISRKRRLDALNPTSSSSSSSAEETAAATLPSIEQSEQMSSAANVNTITYTTSSEKEDDDNDKQAKRRQLLSQRILSSRESFRKRKKKIVSILKKCRYGPIATNDNTATTGNDQDDILKKMLSSATSTSATATSDKTTSKNDKKSSNPDQGQNKRKVNLLKSLIISNKRVLFAAPSKLKQIRTYQVDPNEYILTPSDEYDNDDSINDTLPMNSNNNSDNNSNNNNGINNDSHHEYVRNAPQHTKEATEAEIEKSIFPAGEPAVTANAATTTGQPTGEGEDKYKWNPPIKRNPSNELLNHIESGTLEEMINCLKNGANARGSDNIKPISVIKNQIQDLKDEKNYILTKPTSSSNATSSLSSTISVNNEQMKSINNKLRGLNQKYNALKIYKEVEVVIDIARNIDYKKSEKEVRDKRHQCARRIKDVVNWIVCFQKDTAKSLDINDCPLIDVNISFFHNTTLLHAAVFVYAVDVIEYLRSKGAKTTIKSAKLGTVIDLAKNLAMKAKGRGDAKIENGFQHIIRLLQR